MKTENISKAILPKPTRSVQNVGILLSVTEKMIGLLLMSEISDGKTNIRG